MKKEEELYHRKINYLDAGVRSLPRFPYRLASPTVTLYFLAFLFLF
jgi:hypothetical protein